MSTTQTTISRLIRTEFDKTDWWEIEKTTELILTAQSYGLNELAEGMKEDLKN